jgi:hypothetical protein
VLVYENSLVTLTFAPETDTLTAEWSDQENYSLPEVKQTLEKLIEAINNYDVKNLLIDASKANLNLTNENYRAFVEYLETAFGKTHIQKLARVKTFDPLREEKIYTIRQKVNLPYDFRDFKTKDEAIKWLAS